MAQTVNEIMTHDPVTVEKDATLVEAARKMREADTGAVIVTDKGRLAGIVTDRDITVRGIADGRDPKSTTVADVATTGVQALSPNQSVDDAIRVIREHDVRRVPVVQDDRPVGIVSIGDLAIERDEDSALADLSSAPPNN